MILADRLRVIRDAKHLSQSDIEKGTGLPPGYVFLVENGATVPRIETLEKWAEALGVPLSTLFYEGELPPVLLNLPSRLSADDIVWASSGREMRRSK
jgi:transcriptional regulator with XRE-family HTH domain